MSMNLKTENGRPSRRIFLAGLGALGGLPVLQATPFAQGGAGSALPFGTGAQAAGKSLSLQTMQQATRMAPQLLTGTCALTPSQVEGPFYLPLNLVRQDITEGYPGTETILVLGVRDQACAPVPGAIVDVWHSDYLGDYSSFQGAGTTQMRGIQTTNQNGLVFFRTMYPGWYPGRTPHIHVKVFMPGSPQALTTQIYFDDFLSTWIYTNIPAYANRGGLSPVNNQTDGFFDSRNLVTWIPDQAAGRVFAGTILTA